MAIEFACDQCGNLHHVADGLAGQSARCRCGNQIRVPDALGNQREPATEAESSAPKLVSNADPLQALVEEELSLAAVPAAAPRLSASPVYNPKRVAVRFVKPEFMTAGLAKKLALTAALVVAVSLLVLLLLSKNVGLYLSIGVTFAALILFVVGNFTLLLYAFQEDVVKPAVTS